MLQWPQWPPLQKRGAVPYRSTRVNPSLKSERPWQSNHPERNVMQNGWNVRKCGGARPTPRAARPTRSPTRRGKTLVSLGPTNCASHLLRGGPIRPPTRPSVKRRTMNLGVPNGTCRKTGHPGARHQCPRQSPKFPSEPRSPSPGPNCERTPGPGIHPSRLGPLRKAGCASRCYWTLVPIPCARRCSY